MKVGLFFGSFNPIHNGHLIIANYVCETTELDQVWFVVSPHSPFKEKNTLLKEYDRLHLVKLAIEGNQNLRASDIEFKLPQPSYTMDTLAHLRDKFPEHSFSLIMGGDNVVGLPKWKNAELLLRDYPIYVYNRKDAVITNLPKGRAIHVLDVPLLDISASFIREHLRKGVSMQYFLPDKVWEYVRDYRLYK
ncbi:MAG: nicotinate (nicotinamide) nucleotide adenylyltransferase [Chitinophagales bacterium]